MPKQVDFLRHDNGYYGKYFTTEIHLDFTVSVYLGGVGAEYNPVLRGSFFIFLIYLLGSYQKGRQLTEILPSVITSRKIR